MSSIGGGGNFNPNQYSEQYTQETQSSEATQAASANAPQQKEKEGLTAYASLLHHYISAQIMVAGRSAEENRNALQQRQQQAEVLNDELDTMSGVGNPDLNAVNVNPDGQVTGMGQSALGPISVSPELAKHEKTVQQIQTNLANGTITPAQAQADLEGVTAQMKGFPAYQAGDQATTSLNAAVQAVVQEYESALSVPSNTISPNQTGQEMISQLQSYVKAHPPADKAITTGVNSLESLPSWAQNL